jgi:teichuronic acid biosynthesis glycosyltransferase TuaG
MILASVIMPYFRKKDFFKESYYSVLKQNIKNIEIIVIYDDNDISELNFVKKIINNHKSTKLIINKKNLGVGVSRNLGIKIAKGEYICFLDCDDIWKKGKLKYQIDFMKRNFLDFTHTSYSVINQNGKFLYSLKAKKELTYNNLIRSCDIALSTVVIKKKILSKHKFTKIVTKEDYLLWLQLVKDNIKIVGIKKIFCLWRNVKNSLSGNNWQKIKDAFKIYYIYEKKNSIKTIMSVFILSLFALKKKLEYFKL